MRALVITAWAFATLATAASAPAQSLTPAAAGTIRKLPELGLFDLAPVGDAVQSSYFRSTTANREFRRGVAEFSIPPATILSATLVLAETRATIGAPLPPDVHHVSSYTPTDLAVTTADYDRAGAAVGTFATDANEAPQTFTFDVTALAVAAAGGTLGFRVQLEADPAYADLGTLGSAFAVTLEIVTAPRTRLRALPGGSAGEQEPDRQVLARPAWLPEGDDVVGSARHLGPA